MAVIPRFFTQRDATPAISNAQMDPGTAAAPYRAAEQASAHLMDIFQNELGAWGKVVAQKDAEQKAAEEKNRKVADGLYNAEALANITMGSNDIKQRALAQADGTTNQAKVADEEFQKLFDSVIANAPSNEAKIALTKRALSIRSGLYNNVSNASIKANNQVNMDKIEGMLGQYEAYASNNPADVESVKAQAGDVFQSMEALGIPAHAREKIQQKFLTNLDYQSAASSAEKDPKGVLDALDSGQFNHLGANSLKKIKTVANHSLKASTKQAKDALADVEKSIMLGAPIPQDFADRAALANKLGLHDELTDVERLVDVSKTMAGKKLPEILATSAELKAMAARGELEGSPAKVKKLITFVDTQAKALQKDPFQFAENQGAFKPFPTVTDFKNLAPEEVQQRRYRSMQVEEAYGVKSPALSQAEMDVALAQLNSEPPQERLKILQNLQGMGDETVSRIVNMADQKKDLGLAQAMRLSSIDPMMSMKILEGRDAIKAGNYKADKAEENQAKEALSRLAVDDSIKQSALSAAKAVQAVDRSMSLSELVNQANNVISVDRNGLFSGSYSTVAPAANMTAPDLERLVDEGLSDTDSWKTFGTGYPAQTADGRALPSNRVRPSDYDYVMQKDGTYRLMHEGKQVLDPSGAPVSVDLVKLHKSRGL